MRRHLAHCWAVTLVSTFDQELKDLMRNSVGVCSLLFPNQCLVLAMPGSKRPISLGDNRSSRLLLCSCF